MLPPDGNSSLHAHSVEGNETKSVRCFVSRQPELEAAGRASLRAAGGPPSASVCTMGAFIRG